MRIKNARLLSNRELTQVEDFGTLRIIIENQYNLLTHFPIFFLQIIYIFAKHNM